MKRILIIPIGSVDPAIFKTISASLEKTFHCMIEIGAEMPIPLTSYDSRRNQYDSTTILETLRDITRRDRDRVLGVADADLSVPGLNFVFGEADASAGVAVISLTMLRQEFYGLRRNTGLFHDRTVKEAIHELGHTCGLGHCPDPHCIMHFSNSLWDTDKKGPEFCTPCKKYVRYLILIMRGYFPPPWILTPMPTAFTIMTNRRISNAGH